MEQERTEEASQNQSRTAGNRVFDLLVYPTIAFGVVFAFSAWMLHTTKFGKGYWKETYDYWVRNTTEWLGKRSFFKTTPLEDITVKAKHYVDVLISFAAGTLLISPIKIFEDHRQTFSRKLDILMGTEPKDPSAYQQEPKQGWVSVLGGRALTFGIVLGVSTVGGKYIDRVLETTAKGFEGAWKSFNPNASAKALQRAREWSFVSAFEGFYTAVCAVLLYVISRFLARSMNTPTTNNTITPLPSSSVEPTRVVEPAIASKQEHTPHRLISSVEHQHTITPSQLAMEAQT